MAASKDETTKTSPSVASQQTSTSPASSSPQVTGTTFNYVNALGRKGALMPCVPVRLIDIHGNSMPATTPGLVDSGADSTILPFHWAALLGIDLDADCEEASCKTAGGDGMQSIYHPGLEAIIANEKIHIEAIFADTPLVLLGRDDFFRMFKVSFDHRAGTFYVEPY